MKHLFSKLFISALLLFTLQLSYAQQMPPIPIDPNVRIGKLENGLTYYIRHNSLPEQRADFYIAQKVGSIQEEDDQRGLAHFLEHMCFNGTTHFPGDELKHYLETIGVRFGENLNAYTSVDETVYNISNVPVIREGIVDSCLLILHDWANDLLLEEEEIDKERGVIHEEWRTRTGAVMRMYEKAFPVIYEGSKYAYRLPIGIMEVVDNFPYQTLRDYYEKWYRPDLQGIIVVGDIDVDQVEQKIISLFSPIEMPENPAERIYYPVPDNEEPIITIQQDREQPNVQVLIFNKHDTYPDELKGSMEYLVIEYGKQMIDEMFNARLNELMQTPNPPFIYAVGYDGNFLVSQTKDAFTGIVVAKEDDITTGIGAMFCEMERVHRFGFTDTEYARARAEYVRRLESAYNERDKEKNEKYVEEYVRHFLENEPIPGIENEYAIMNQIIPHIPVEAINQMVHEMITGNNLVITVLGPEKEELVYPTNAEILSVIEKVKSEEITPYEDNVSDEPLISEAPVGGKVVSVDQNAPYGTTLLTLSNGVRVVVKHTDYKADEVLLKGFSFGGNSLFPDSEVINFKSLNDVMEISGLGNFSAVDLEKVLAGKKASASASVGTYTEGINGSCSPKDFETMLQLVYLSFTAPRMDVDAFESYKNRTKAALQNMEADPGIAFSDSVSVAIYGNVPRILRLKSNMIDQIDYPTIMEMYQDRFKDASDFIFMLVGNINLDEATPLIEEYLGGLPSIDRKETFKDLNLRIRQGEYKNEFKKELEIPKATVFALYNTECPYTLENSLLVTVLAQTLDLVYTEEVREKEGGTYGVYVGGDVDKYPNERAVIQIVFDTDPERRETMIEIILNEAKKMAQEGPSLVNLNKVKEFLLKKHAENLKENRYWVNALDEYYYTGTDLVTDYEKVLDSITIEKVKQFAAKLFEQNNQIEVIMTAEGME